MNVIIVVLLVAILAGLGLVMMNVEDINTTLHLVDVACDE